MTLVYKKHHRHPWSTIKFTINLYNKNKGKLSFRKISDFLKENEIYVSHKTIFQWVKKYSEDVKKPLKDLENIIRK
jgi:transposase-like protein